MGIYTYAVAKLLKFSIVVAFMMVVTAFKCSLDARQPDQLLDTSFISVLQHDLPKTKTST